MVTDNHEYDDCRFYDPESKEWGYRRMCLTPGHEHQECPMEEEIVQSAHRLRLAHLKVARNV